MRALKLGVLGDVGRSVGLLPMLAVKVLGRDACDRARVDAVDCHSHAVRIAARDVERLDATDLAEQVLGPPRVERVQRQLVLAGEKAEARGRYNRVRVLLEVAYGAIADCAHQRRRRVEFERDGAAVARTAVRHKPAGGRGRSATPGVVRHHGEGEGGEDLQQTTECPLDGEWRM
jgi:hypothetical protein